jgi:hypothetical protein
MSVTDECRPPSQHSANRTHEAVNQLASVLCFRLHYPQPCKSRIVDILYLQG